MQISKIFGIEKFRNLNGEPMEREKFYELFLTARDARPVTFPYLFLVPPFLDGAVPFSVPSSSAVVLLLLDLLEPLPFDPV